MKVVVALPWGTFVDDTATVSMNPTSPLLPPTLARASSPDILHTCVCAAPLPYDTAKRTWVAVFAPQRHVDIVDNGEGKAAEENVKPMHADWLPFPLNLVLFPETELVLTACTFGASRTASEAADIPPLRFVFPSEEGPPLWLGLSAEAWRACKPAWTAAIAQRTIDSWVSDAFDVQHAATNLQPDASLPSGDGTVPGSAADDIAAFVEHSSKTLKGPGWQSTEGVGINGGLGGKYPDTDEDTLGEDVLSSDDADSASSSSGSSSSDTEDGGVDGGDDDDDNEDNNGDDDDDDDDDCEDDDDGKGGDGPGGSGGPSGGLLDDDMDDLPMIL